MTIRSLLFICLLVPGLLQAQRPQQRKFKDPFPTFGEFERKGWIISPMLTFTMSPGKQASERLFASGTEVYDVEYQAVGRMGIGIEVGRFHLIDSSPFLHSVEFSGGIKRLRGVERFEAFEVDANQTSDVPILGDGDFIHDFATIHVRLNHVKPLGDFSFLINSIGINGDYMFSSTTRYNPRNLPIVPVDGEPLLLQAHYRIGYGFKLTKRLIAVPSVETPIITAFPFDDFKSSSLVFHSRYRPIIVRLSLYLLDRKSGRTCPTDKKRKKSESLFGMASPRSPW